MACDRSIRGGRDGTSICTCVSLPELTIFDPPLMSHLCPNYRTWPSVRHIQGTRYGCLSGAVAPSRTSTGLAPSLVQKPAQETYFLPQETKLSTESLLVDSGAHTGLETRDLESRLQMTLDYASRLKYHPSLRVQRKRPQIHNKEQVPEHRRNLHKPKERDNPTENRAKETDWWSLQRKTGLVH